MAFPALYLIINLFVLVADAAPTTTSPQGQVSSQALSGWSTEAYIALSGVLVTLLGIVVTFAVSSKLRRKLKRCITRNRQQSIQQLRQKYDDYRKFQEWLEMTAS